MRTILMALLSLAIGCTGRVATIDTPVPFQGKLSKRGAPLGDVQLTLQPTGPGFVTAVDVSADGLFKGEAVPGQYMYFVGKSQSKTSVKKLKELDPKFLEADVVRVVSVKPGEVVEVALD